MFINTLTENTRTLYCDVLDFCKQDTNNKLCEILLEKVLKLDQKARHIYSGSCAQDVLLNLSEICLLCNDCVYLIKLLESKSELIKRFNSLSRLTKKHMNTFRQMLKDSEK